MTAAELSHRKNETKKINVTLLHIPFPPVRFVTSSYLLRHVAERCIADVGPGDRRRRIRSLFDVSMAPAGVVRAHRVRLAYGYVDTAVTRFSMILQYGQIVLRVNVISCKKKK